jgi:hypothetical protein
MAFKPEEIQRLQTMADEMAGLIQDTNNTSNDAAVVYGKIGRACARALANDAAVAARLAKRTENVLKFQQARQARQQQRGGATAQPPAAAQQRA